jgi:hypothetical protein
VEFGVHLSAMEATLKGVPHDPPTYPKSPPGLPLMGLFDALFGKGAARGHDIIHELSLTVDDVTGADEREIEFDRLGTCRECKGRGHASCACKGSGQTQETHRVNLSTGPWIVRHILAAGGEQPARLRISGEGEAGFKGGEHGDLYVDISIDFGDSEDEQEQIFMRALAARHELQTVDLDDTAPTPEAIARMDAELAWELHACPVNVSDGILRVAISDPTAESDLARLHESLGGDIEFVLTTRDQVAHALMQVYAE